MTKHQKRLSVPNRWPVERKTEKFTVKADAGPHGEAGVPLLVLLRDVLGYVDSRKEARYALNQDNVIINGKAVSDEERPVGMFDILAFDERNEYYRVFPGEGGRLALTPIDADAAESKLGKIVEKRHVDGGDIQLTLHDGQTLLVEDDSYDGGDSLVVANESDEIVAHFQYEEGALVTSVDGSHSGEIGVIDEIQVTPGSASNNVIANQDVNFLDGSGSFETIEEYIVVIDENFVEGGDETDADEAVDESEPEVGDDETDSSDEPEQESGDVETDDTESSDESETESADVEADDTESSDESETESADVEADDTDTEAEESDATDESDAADEDEGDAGGDEE